MAKQTGRKKHRQVKPRVSQPAAQKDAIRLTERVKLVNREMGHEEARRWAKGEPAAMAAMMAEHRAGRSGWMLVPEGYQWQQFGAQGYLWR
jgi:hypothetical protein